MEKEHSPTDHCRCVRDKATCDCKSELLGCGKTGVSRICGWCVDRAFFFLHSKPNKALLLVLSFRGKKGQNGLFHFPFFYARNVENFQLKKKFPKEKKICEGKILNFQEYSICPNEIFKVD